MPNERHTIPTTLNEKTVRVALAGVGGTGSRLLTDLAHLHMGLISVGHPGGLQVVAYDPDKVAEHNVGRQLFYPSDVGQNKAVALVSRLNMAYGLEWEAWPADYRNEHACDLLVTCVDTVRTRREIYRAALSRKGFYSGDVEYWLDCGNRRRDGQLIMGQLHTKYSWRNGHSTQLPRLPHLFDLYPNLLAEDYPEDETPSCSLAEALEQQDLTINKHVATWAATLLWKLFRQIELEEHGYYINVDQGRVNPLEIEHIQPTRQTSTESGEPENRKTRKRRRK